MTILPFTLREIILTILLLYFITLWVLAIRKLHRLYRILEIEQSKQQKQSTNDCHGFCSIVVGGILSLKTSAGRGDE